MNLIGEYKNGNCAVKIYENGTKVRYTDDDEFYPEFAESLDVRITSRCGQGCAWCYEGNKPNGVDADLLGDEYIDLVDSFHPFTEVAIGGNDLNHPQLDGFLNLMRIKQVIVNVTVSQSQCITNLEKLAKLQEYGLIRGVGVSLEHPNDELFSALKTLRHVVVHVVYGLASKSDIESLSNNGVVLLVLGYKKKGRGTTYFAKHQDEIAKNQKYLLKSLPKLKEGFNAVCFDNLAVKQLSLKKLVGEKEWEMSYMGNDGEFSFYIDLVKGEYGKSSTSTSMKKINGMNVDQMFESFKNKK